MKKKEKAYVRIASGDNYAAIIDVDTVSGAKKIIQMSDEIIWYRDQTQQNLEKWIWGKASKADLKWLNDQNWEENSYRWEEGEESGLKKGGD